MRRHRAAASTNHGIAMPHTPTSESQRRQKEEVWKEWSQDSYPPLSAAEDPVTTPTTLTMIR